jgi:hypothetical protein
MSYRRQKRNPLGRWIVSAQAASFFSFFQRLAMTKLSLPDYDRFTLVWQAGCSYLGNNKKL